MKFIQQILFISFKYHLPSYPFKSLQTSFMPNFQLNSPSQNHSSSTQDAQNKRAEIREHNTKNSQLLKNINLGPFNFDLTFPDKFSHDLKDIERTCEIQSMLIQRISKLENQNIYYQRQHNLIKKYQDQLNAANIEKKKLKEELDHEKGINEQLKTILRQQRQLSSSKQSSKQLMIDNRQLRAPNIWINSFNAKSNKDAFMSYFQGHHKKFHQEIMQDNQKMKIWLKKFIERLDNILKVRLQQLNQNEHLQSSTDTWPQKRHSNGTTNSLDKQHFPLDEMLNDFENIFRTQHDYKLKLEKYKELNQVKALNRDLVEMVVEQLKQFHQSIIETFKLIGDQREELKNEYQNFFNFQLSGIQWIQNIDTQKMIQMAKFPITIMNKIKHLSFDIMKKKKREQLIENAQNFKQNKSIQKIRQVENAKRSKINKKLEENQIISDSYSPKQKQRSMRQREIQVATIYNLETYQKSSKDLKMRRDEEPPRANQYQDVEI